VGFVEKKTDIWSRPFLSSSIQEKFVKVAEGYIDTLRSDTDMVALQYDFLCFTTQYSLPSPTY